MVEKAKIIFFFLPNWQEMNPDINPVENLWRELKFSAAKWTPVNLKELEKSVMEEWQTLSADV